MLGVTAKPITQALPQANSESDVERVTIAKNDITTTNSSDGNAALKIIQEKLVTQTDKSAMTGDPWKPMLRAPAPLKSGALQESSPQEITTETESQTYKLAEILATLSTALGDSAIATQQLRGQARQIISSSASAITSEAYATAENAQTAVDGAEADVDSAWAQKDAADQKLVEADASVDDANKVLDGANTVLDGANEVLDDANEVLDDANKALDRIHRESDEQLSFLKELVQEDCDSLKEHLNTGKNSWHGVVRKLESLADDGGVIGPVASDALGFIQAVKNDLNALNLLIKYNPAPIPDSGLPKDIETIITEIKSLVGEIEYSLRFLDSEVPSNNLIHNYLDSVRNEISAAKQYIESIQLHSAEIQDLESQIKSAESQVSTAKQQVSAAKQQVSAAEQQVSAAENALQQALTVRTGAREDVAIAIQNIAVKREALSAANRALDKANSAIPGAVKQTQSLKQLDKTGGGVNQVDLLMAQLVTILGKCNEDTLKTNMALAKTQQTAKQAELGEQTDKAEKETAKQKRMNKIFGWVSKIVGAVLMVAGAVSAVFTGGAMAVLFVIGAALTVSDQITKAVTGESYMAKATNAILGGIAKMFEAMGIDEKTSKILALVTMVALLIVGAVLMKQGAKAASKIMGKVMKHVMKHVMKSVVEGATKKVATGGLKRGIRIGADITMSSSRVLGQLTGAASSVGNGIYEQRRDEISAQLMEIMKDTDFIKQFMDMVLENYSNTMKTMNAIIKGETEASGMAMQVGKQILAQSRA